MHWCNGGRLAHPEGLPEKHGVRLPAGAFPQQGAHRPLGHVRPRAPAADVHLEPLSAQLLHCTGNAIQSEQGPNAVSAKEGEWLPC
eukprot:3480425-Pyramimonas_sp.AAC.2